jgi:hypothetical protein
VKCRSSTIDAAFIHDGNGLLDALLVVSCTHMLDLLVRIDTVSHQVRNSIVIVLGRILDRVMNGTGKAILRCSMGMPYSWI